MNKLKKIATAAVTLVTAATLTVATAPAAEAASYTRSGMTVNTNWPGYASSMYRYGYHRAVSICGNGKEKWGPLTQSWRYSNAPVCWGWEGGLFVAQGRTASGTVVASIFNW